MSISDLIVVMKDGMVNQIGKPQQVYDDPANLFVAKFLGTPPINVFSGRVESGMLMIGSDAVLTVAGVEDQELIVGIRPEGFLPNDNGPLHYRLRNVEIMGRDVSIVCENDACEAPTVRAILQSDGTVPNPAQDVRFRLKPGKVLLFHPETGARIPFTAQ